jgi:hypothetical protein
MTQSPAGVTRVALRAALGRDVPQRHAGMNVRCDISIAQSRQSASGPPKSRLLGALVGRSIEVRLSSKADVRLAAVIDHHGPQADMAHLIGPRGHEDLVSDASAIGPLSEPSSSLRKFQSKNSTAPVSRLYIAPVILTPPFASISASTGLSFRISATSWASAAHDPGHAARASALVGTRD